MVTYKIEDSYVFCTGPCYYCKEPSESGDYYHIWEHKEGQEKFRRGPADCCLDCARALGLVW